MLLLNRSVLIFLIVVPLGIFSFNLGVLASDNKQASSDVLEGEDEANVEDGGVESILPADKATGDDEETEEETSYLKPSNDADTFFLFTKPTGMGLELPAGSSVNFLVGFSNNGKKDFLLETMDASFRYAMDFSFHLQNFSAIPYYRSVKPGQEATLAYSFFISDAYSTRPYGLTVNLFYKDQDGNRFMNAVFNETVNIVEVDEGLDGETFFLYLFLVALGVLVLVGAQQLLASLGKKRSVSKPKEDLATVTSGDVDYDWLPKETLHKINKSPRNEKYSPRQRKVKRGTGHADDK